MWCGPGLRSGDVVKRNLAIALFLLGACSDSRGGAGSPPGNPRVVTTLSVDSIPTLIILDSSALFGHVVGAARLSNGAVVVADGYELTITTFDSAGRRINSVGGRGGGPGEFQNITWLQQCSDGDVYALDHALTRMTVLEGNGSTVRQFSFSEPSATLDCSGKGFAILKVSDVITEAPSEKSPRYMGQLILLSNSGDSVWAVSGIPVGENRPLGLKTRIALGDDRLYVGTSDSASVDVYDLSGRRQSALKVGGGVRSPTTHNYERAIDNLLAQLPGGTAQVRDMFKQRLMAIPMPEHLPSYSDLFVDPDGLLWAVTSAPGDEHTDLQVVAPSGQEVGSLRLPLEMRVLEIGRSYILGAYLGEDGQEHVAVYHLRRG